ncbi:protein of unknown function [Candidatus Nitrotoga arctica]|uniref:Uncharacterized protein n=1 Tax=Candidatus Nitrotoga arctica TaxID=453162 RepID=A0ABN8APN5_9PROT|nr:protein of unknown function [Candidatus Nitrotoga arctica]
MTRTPLHKTLPHSKASTDKDRVLKKRAAHSHLSMRNLTSSFFSSRVFINYKL